MTELAQPAVTEAASSATETVHRPACCRIRLQAFSERDLLLLQRFLSRPGSTAGGTLSVVNAQEDTLIINATHEEGRAALGDWDPKRPTIAIVSRFESNAPYYQVALDDRLLFSIAQAITRIRAGWQPGLMANTPSAPVTFTPASQADTTRESADKTNTEAKAGESAGSEVAAETTTAFPVLDVLIVDDSAFTRASVAEAMKRVGFQTQTAAGGDDALYYANDRKFDVAVVDFEMPGMKGPDVLRHLQALGKQAPSVLIMLTSRSGSMDKLRAKLAGADAFMTKPAQMANFLSLIQEFDRAGKFKK